MRMTSLLFLSVLCSGLTTVAVGQLDDFDRGSPPARNRTNSADVFYGNDSDTPGFTKPRALVPVALVKFVVHTPSGEPAGLAQVELYRGEVVNVHVAGDESSEIKITVPDSFSRSGQQRRQSFPADGDGTFEAPVVGPTKLVIIHESGYDIQTVKPDAEKLDRPKETTGPQIIKLQPWGHVSGRVTLNKKPPTGRRVSARWESFPFSSSMLNLEADQRVQGPPLVSISQTVDISENGEYTFTKLPPGRLRLRLAEPEKEVKTSAGPILAGNAEWWQTAESQPMAVAKKLDGLPNPFEGDTPAENVFDFSVMSVKGRIKLTDELFERRVTVNRTANGVEAGQADLIVAFSASVPQPSEDLFERQTLEEAVRAAVVWGRPGGKREAMVDRVVSAPVDRNGAFECVLRAREYNVELMMSAKRYIGAEGHIYHEFETLATDIAKVTIKGIDDVVDFGEIEVELIAPSAGDFADSRELTPFGSDSREFTEPGGFRDPQERQPTDNRRDAFENRHESDQMPTPTPPRNANPDFFGEPRVAAAVPIPATTPVDQAIARLVTDLLAAGDRRTRENMRTPLKELLQQKFDAEQRARETLLTQLRKRLEEASQQVAERKQKKDEIVTEQLDRMMSLPEDRFLPMDAVKPALDTTAGGTYDTEPRSSKLPLERGSPFDSNPPDNGRFLPASPARTPEPEPKRKPGESGKKVPQRNVINRS